MIDPKPLFPGARVALVAPASAVPEEKLPGALDLVRRLGMEPVLYPSCYFANRDGYLAATDAQRAEDINRAFADKTIDGVWCIRGGYGGHRILPLLDADAIRKNPKWFGGYSDVTALHLFLKKALFGGLNGALSNPEGQSIRTLVPGKAEGILCGGNLSLLAASLGTPWEVDTKGKILFLEDIGEKTYRLDSMLTQLRNAGKFRDCAGIILGAWTDCVPEMPERTLTLDEIFTQLIVPAGKPAVMDLACGHCATTLALPMGRKCRLNADAGSITLEA